MKSFPDNYFDWVYIDGDHTTKAVYADLQVCFEKVKSNGFIAGDDCDFNEKTNQTRIGVAKAVTLFMQSYPVKLISSKHVQFVLQVKK